MLQSLMRWLGPGVPASRVQEQGGSAMSTQTTQRQTHRETTGDERQSEQLWKNDYWWWVWQSCPKREEDQWQSLKLCVTKGDQEQAGGEATWIGFIALGLSDGWLHLPGEKTDHTGVRQDGTGTDWRFLGGELVGENWQKRASGLIFLEPGRYVMEKLNWPKNSVQRAWREIKSLDQIRSAESLDCFKRLLIFIGEPFYRFSIPVLCFGLLAWSLPYYAVFYIVIYFDVFLFFFSFLVFSFSFIIYTFSFFMYVFVKYFVTVCFKKCYINKALLTYLHVLYHPLPES